MRGRVGILQRELDQKRESFTQIITDANAAVVEQAAAVQDSFAHYADEFLMKAATYSGRHILTRLGKLARRSISQRLNWTLEAAISVGPCGGTALITYQRASENSLTFLFAWPSRWSRPMGRLLAWLWMHPNRRSTPYSWRVRRVFLGRFGRPDTGNRLVIASNLVDGQLIPDLLKEAADENDRVRRVVDLLSIAAPTAALVRYRKEYFDARDHLLQLAEPG